MWQKRKWVLHAPNSRLESASHAPCRQPAFWRAVRKQGEVAINRAPRRRTQASTCCSTHCQQGHGPAVLPRRPAFRERPEAHASELARRARTPCAVVCRQQPARQQ
jgi:hypothetical protein